MKVQKILVPVDFSDHAQQALQWGADLAEKYGARVLLLHVLPKAVEEVFTEAPTWEDIPAYYLEGMSRSKNPHYTEPIIIDLVEQAQTQLDDLARTDLKETVAVQARVAVGKPPDEILRVAHEEAVDLIKPRGAEPPPFRAGEERTPPFLLDYRANISYAMRHETDLAITTAPDR